LSRRRLRVSDLRVGDTVAVKVTVLRTNIKEGDLAVIVRKLPDPEFPWQVSAINNGAVLGYASHELEFVSRGLDVPYVSYLDAN
jgi:hypothetical protein